MQGTLAVTLLALSLATCLQVCQRGQFVCTNGSCISESQRCDHETDCADGSDEIDCDFKCKTPGVEPCQVVSNCSSVNLCDHRKDCGNWSDQLNCTREMCLKKKTQLECEWVEFFGCYCFSADGVNKTWREAKELCEANQMDLVSLETADKEDVLYSLIWKKFKPGPEKIFWTSGKKMAKKREWIWSARKTAIKSTKIVERADDRHHQYLTLHWVGPFQWHSSYPHWESSVICESRPLPHPENPQRRQFRQPLQFCPDNIGLNSTCRRFDTVGCHCAVLVLKSRIEASRYCQDYGMQLVSVNLPSEQDALFTLLFHLDNSESFGHDFWTSGWEMYLNAYWWPVHKSAIRFSPIIYDSRYPDLGNTYASVIDGRRNYYYKLKRLNYDYFSGSHYDARYFICEFLTMFRSYAVVGLG